MGPLVEAGAARGKFAIPKLINDPVCHAAAILKGPFLNFFLENKRGENYGYAIAS